MANRKIITFIIIPVCIILLFVLSLTLVQLFTQNNNVLTRDNSIAIIEVQGLIIDSRETIEQLQYIKEKESIKAVVLRIDSPGGVVGPTQEIYEEVKKLKKIKPVIVSMGSVAASGGYYIAVPANKIFANPGTITGSIGVLMKLTNFEDLIKKVGIKSIVLKSGEFKDTGSPVRPLSIQDKKVLEGVIQSMYGQFVTAVAEGRKIPVEQVKVLADGRIYTGEQAFNNKLIDKMGNLQDAVDEAAKIVGIKDKPEIVYPPKPKRSIFDILVEGVSENLVKAFKAESGVREIFEFSLKTL
jgi:protease-4